MTLAAFPDRPSHRCDPRGCTHAVCEGCGATCSVEDLIVTTTRRYAVCSACYPSVAASWSRTRTSRRPTFESLVETRGPDECWPWTGRRDANGYGKFGVRWAHRAAYRLAHPDADMAGLVVCHACDNPPCCNPAHLWLGTQADNARDAMVKGRLAWRPDHAFRVDPSRGPQGSNHWKARLTDDVVREIRRRVASGEPQASLAREYGVKPAGINDIVKMRNWRHV